MDTKNLHQLAKDIYRGLVFVMGATKDDNSESFARELMIRFPVLQFCGKNAIEEIQSKHPVVFYEYLDKAVKGRVVNNGPCFFSIRYLGYEDWKVVTDHITLIEQTVDAGVEP